MRPATPSDVPAIVQALKAMLVYSPAPQMKHADIMAAELGVRDAVHEERAVIVGDFFIMYDMAKPWFSNKKFLIEDIVLRISREHGTQVKEAVAALDALRVKHGCDGVIVGDTQIGYMQHHYVKAGYTVLGVQLLKG
jgi:hypothetical protein